MAVTAPARTRPRRSPPPRKRGALRGLVVLLLVGAWLGIAAVGGPLVGRLSEVQDNDNANFLPSTAESTEVSRLAAGFAENQALPYVAVVERTGGLTTADLAAVAAWAEGVPDVEVEAADGARVGDFLTGDPLVPVPSEDGEAVLVAVPLDADQAGDTIGDGEGVVFAVAEALRADLVTDVAPPDEGAALQAWVAGPGGVLADLVTAFEGIDGRLLQVTLTVVFVILLLVYRSPLLPFAALLSALFALSLAGLAVYPLAAAGALDLSGQSQGILFILVVGAATDYALLLVARYREELHDTDSPWSAMSRAWRATLEPVAASASTVILGLLCLLLADLGSTRGLGPVGAIGVAGAFLAVLTFLPVLLLVPVLLLTLLLAGVAAGLGAVVAGGAGALAGALVVVLAVVVLGVQRWRALHGGALGAHGAPPWYARVPASRWLFWPRVPRTDHVHAEDAVGGRSLWGRVAGLVGDHPRRVWVVTLAALLGLSAAAPTFAASGIRQTDVFRDRVDAVVGQEVLERHFPAGSVAPAVVVAPAGDAADVAEAAAAVPGVVGVDVTTEAPPGAPPGTGEPLVVDGLVQLQAVLEPAYDSPEAEAVVADLRTSLDDVSRDALVGGQTATNLDVRDASDRDLRVVVPAVLVVILVVLIPLLRSLTAPLLLVAANLVSFAATLGAAAIVFNVVLDLPGGDPAIPLYGFVFLVALGIDYSIFLMTRVREEAHRRGPRPGVLVGLAVTGGVITSAGVVLAATFGALATLPLLFLLQIAFLVSFGVLLDTLVVRSLLVPAIAYDLGRRTWWPGRLARRPERAEVRS
jgi:putative drug exporter of the RND superfamily